MQNGLYIGKLFLLGLVLFGRMEMRGCTPGCDGRWTLDRAASTAPFYELDRAAQLDVDHSEGLVRIVFQQQNGAAERIISTGRRTTPAAWMNSLPRPY